VNFNTLLQYNDVLEKALKNNTLIKQNEMQSSIAQNNLNVSKAGKYPTLGVNSSYQWNKNFNQSTSFLAESMNYGINAGVSLRYNIFDGGTTKTRIANAKIAIDNQELINKQNKDNLKVLVKNTWDDYQNKLFVFNTQKLNVTTAQNNFDRTNERFKLGQISSIEFRQAQVNLLQALTAVNNAKYDAILIELNLIQLSGNLLNIDF
jgi:outer membrane protein TolC